MKILKQIGDNKSCPVVAFIKNKRILIGLRHYTPDKWKQISIWTLPGGRSDGKEPLETTLRREVAEEIGIFNFELIHYLGSVPGAKKGDIVFVFLGRTAEEPKLLEPEKFSDWRWEKPDKIPSNFINPAALELITKYLKSKSLEA